MLPAICCSETLAMEMSSTSMNAASATTGAMIQRVGWPGSAGRVRVSPVTLIAGLASVLAGRRRGARVDRRDDGHPEAQHMGRIDRPLEDDLHRYPLHHLDVVAGGILGGQQAEAGAGAPHDAVDAPLEWAGRIGIEGNFDRLAGTHPVELGLLEV